MASYCKDCTGVVHVVSSDIEFMFCSLAWDVDCSNDERFVGEPMVQCSGPATCSDCKHAIETAKAAMKGARFKVNGGEK